jgi:non-heme chloroperoxidase
MLRRNVLLSAIATGALGTAVDTAGAASVAPSATDTRRGAKIRTRDGVELFHRDSGAGRPVLFVHSWGVTSAIWGYQEAFLGDHRLRCITFDRRGHGRSDAPSGGYDMDTLADDVDSVIVGLDLHDVVLVGHSMGAGEILRYLARHGSSRVAKIALLAPTTPFVLKTADNAHGAPPEYFDKTRAAWAADYPKWLEDGKHAAFTPETSPDMMDWFKSVMLSVHIPTAIACNRAFVETDLRPDLAKVDRPVLILQGDNDQSAPLEITGRLTAAGIKGAVLKVYPGAPHLLFLTHMAQVNRDLLEFIEA